ncbi:hypothetical protein PNOK_0877400 [Pyrrhoderma noxium]|uniref:Uncharacterized protein n=1 Tax=Pyrrhoderma noxium TaxID=2282107 RepID=A0A286U8M4_9AGAM|nr:hypothetical protein PNOK_0877400 [Pyrrhoderma noxium]
MRIPLTAKEKIRDRCELLRFSKAGFNMGSIYRGPGIRTDLSTTQQTLSTRATSTAESTTSTEVSIWSTSIPSIKSVTIDRQLEITAYQISPEGNSNLQQTDKEVAVQIADNEGKRGSLTVKGSPVDTSQGIDNGPLSNGGLGNVAAISSL